MYDVTVLVLLSVTEYCTAVLSRGLTGHAGEMAIFMLEME